MKISIRCLWLTLLLSPLAATAQPCGPACIAHFAQARRIYDFKITKVEPAVLVEHQPITVNYTLAVRKIGVIGVLGAQSATVCSANHRGSCRPIRDLVPGQTYSGRIQTTAPAAGAAASIQLVLEAPRICAPGIECFGAELLGEAETTRPVAAEYMVQIDSFRIRHTRARRADTVKIDLRAMADGQISDEAIACDIVGPPTFCVVRAPQGDRKDGTHAVSNVAVGPYRLIPETDGNLAVQYNVMNLGEPYEQRVAEMIFNGISDAAGAFMAAYTGGDSWNGVNQFTHDLNGLMFGGCDGPVAVDAHVMLNKLLPGGEASTLDARTRDYGRFSSTNGTYEIESQNGCGKSPRYDVTWSVVRTSWQPWP